jgi:phytoene dehydrogenase-like protein
MNSKFNMRSAGLQKLQNAPVQRHYTPFTKTPSSSKSRRWHDRVNKPTLFTPHASATGSTSRSSTTILEETPPPTSTADRSHETDVVVIGSGIGGLCCAALLARYGYKVTVVESHYHAGGAAHGFQIRGPSGMYHFDAGPSFFAGLSGPPGTSSNPLKQVLDAIGEQVESVSYDKWVVYSPNGTFNCVCDAQQYAQTIRKMGGENAYRQWLALETAMKPLGEGAALFPAAALRADPGIVLSAARFGPALLRTAFMVKELTGPFSNIVDKIVTDPWLKNFLDLECFVLSGMLAKDTIAAEMVYMMTERNSGKSDISYPIGGSEALVNALVRGIEKFGGKVLLRSRVENVILEGGKAVGVKLKKRKSTDKAEIIRARHAVVSNASLWDTLKLLPSNSTTATAATAAAAGVDKLAKQANSTALCGSFMHLHLGIDATDLPEDLQIHHLFVNNWENIEAPQNICIASIPTVISPGMAPPGKAVVHAYTAGNEPWEVWQGVEPGSKEYANLKEERSQCLWESLERVIPDIRARTEVKTVGSPLTHARFLNRHKGTYGAAISARNGSFPGPGTDIPGLYRTGDSCAPGIGVPAAAASGMITANSLVPVWSHLKLLDDLKL